MRTPTPLPLGFVLTALLASTLSAAARSYHLELLRTP